MELDRKNMCITEKIPFLKLNFKINLRICDDMSQNMQWKTRVETN